MDFFKDFQDRFRLIAQEHPNWITNTLSNIFTMRLIGNKTHGDLAEIGIAEFIGQFMYDFDCEHVGKRFFRSKKQEEDVVIVNKIHNQRIPVSLKAYGDGPLQLSTDKEAILFPFLKSFSQKDIKDPHLVNQIMHSTEFESLMDMYVLPLLYRENDMVCNIVNFKFSQFIDETVRIIFVDANEHFDKATHQIVYKPGRKHPVFIFLNKNDDYIAEVRYGNQSANALQRGLWTHTQNAVTYFDSLTNGWISYAHNETLVRLFSLALNATPEAHKNVNDILQADITHLLEKR